MDDVVADPNEKKSVHDRTLGQYHMGGCITSVNVGTSGRLKRAIVGLMTCVHSESGGGHNFMIDSDRTTVYCSETGIQCVLDALELYV